MLDIGWSELLVIGVVALIVVGPKDLPLMFRRLGEFTGKARAMAREFSSAMDKAADEAGVRDVQKDLRSMTDKKSLGLDAIDKAAREMEGWDPDGQATGKAGTGKPPVKNAGKHSGAARDASDPGSGTSDQDRPAEGDAGAAKPAAAAVREAAEAADAEVTAAKAASDEKTA